MDDIIIQHARAYDPAKAHEYYVRTRHLKGREVGTKMVPVLKEVKPVRAVAPKSHQELQRQAEVHLADLQNKLDRLRFHLEQMVNDAKKRSGIATGESTSSGSKSSSSPSSSSSSSKTSSSTKSSSSSSSGSSGSKDPKPLTGKQKHDKAVNDHKNYEKNKELHPNATGVYSDIKQVEERINKVRNQLKAAVEQARRHAEPKSKAA